MQGKQQKESGEKKISSNSWASQPPQGDEDRQGKKLHIEKIQIHVFPEHGRRRGAGSKAEVYTLVFTQSEAFLLSRLVEIGQP